MAIISKSSTDDQIDSLRKTVVHEMQVLTARFNAAIAQESEAKVPVSARDMQIALKVLDAGQFSTDTEWMPAKAMAYCSNHPFREKNPGLAKAGYDLVEGTIDIISRHHLHDSNDATLTYLDSQRAKGGKKSTIITRVLQDADPEGIGHWIANLPRAEQLRPVAHPAKDGVTVELVNDIFVEVPKTKAMSALVGGAGDGRAVIEREALESLIIGEFINNLELPGKKLTVTSLGTGTGEPAMDIAIKVMHERFGDGYTVHLNGFDVDTSSLEIAKHIAEHKAAETGVNGSIIFSDRHANLLSKDGIQQAVGRSNANVFESIGFSEYVASAFATNPQEKKQRKAYEFMGLLSAEEFYHEVYANLPVGAIYITGNMRDDSPQASFVIDGLGWNGIIQRSTLAYMKILERAGIPPEAVVLYVPMQGKSAGVYNMITITKLRK